MNYNRFYFDRLPKFTYIFKKRLCDELSKNSLLSIKDYIKIYFDFYELNSAYEFFKDYKVNRDEMVFSIFLNDIRSIIHIERKIRLEDVDEEFQIQLELVLDMPPVENTVNLMFEVERDYFGGFSNWEEGSFWFEDFYNKVIQSDEVLNYLNLYPNNIGINQNVDL